MSFGSGSFVVVVFFFCENISPLAHTLHDPSEYWNFV